MKPVFADTSFYVALLGRHDAGHARAVEVGENLLGRIVTTEYVLIETGGMLSKGQDLAAFATLVRDLESDSAVEIVPASSSLFRAGFDLFVDRPDKQWSMVDCLSLVVMNRRRLKDVLTTDRHFKQAGFVTLLA